MPGREGRSGVRRAVEWGKNLLIAALTCSAVYLAAQTPMFTQFRGWIAPAEETVAPSSGRSEVGVEPYAIALRNDLGLYGVSYDKTLVDRAFGDILPLLGEGLEGAGAPESITRRQWQVLLERPGIYCAFQGEPPMAVLCAWLGEGENAALSGGAEALLLGRDGERVWLCWRSGGSYYRAGTALDGGALTGLLETYSPNGAAFAYTLAPTDSAYAALDPYVLVSGAVPQCQNYTAAAPDFVQDGEELEKLLAALGFHAGAGSAYESTGEMVVSEGSDRLRAGRNGSVTFHGGEETRYSVTAAGETPTAAEAALAAWELLDRATGPWRGETDYILTGVEEEGDGWTVTFQARLAGLPVLTGEEGWCAVFRVTGRAVTDFTLALRSYSGAGTTALLPSQRLAAAAMGSLPIESGALLLCYPDPGSGVLTAVWMTEGGGL